MKKYTMNASNGSVRPIESDTGEWVRREDMADSIILEVNGDRIGFGVVEFMNGDIKLVAQYHNQPGFAEVE